VYVNSSKACLIEVHIARNKNVKIPLESKSLKSKTGVSSVHLKLSKVELGGNMQGFFTVAVKVKHSSLIHIYWNNKNDLKFSELTPNIPAVTKVHKGKPLYFTFFASESKKLLKNGKVPKDGKITFHFKSDLQATVFITKNKTNELIVPK
jgi:hypothetical protein